MVCTYLPQKAPLVQYNKNHCDSYIVPCMTDTRHGVRSIIIIFCSYFSLPLFLASSLPLSLTLPIQFVDFSSYLPLFVFGSLPLSSLISPLFISSLLTDFLPSFHFFIFYSFLCLFLSLILFYDFFIMFFALTLSSTNLFIPYLSSIVLYLLIYYL